MDAMPGKRRSENINVYTRCNISRTMTSLNQMRKINHTAAAVCQVLKSPLGIKST